MPDLGKKTDVSGMSAEEVKQAAAELGLPTPNQLGTGDTKKADDRKTELAILFDNKFTINSRANGWAVSVVDKHGEVLDLVFNQTRDMLTWIADAFDYCREN